jgi:hypothetical protein
MTEGTAAITISALFMTGSACFLIGNVIALIMAVRS